MSIFVWLALAALWVGAAILTAPLMVREVHGRGNWREESETMDWAFGLVFSLMAWPLILFVGSLVGTVKKVVGVRERAEASKKGST